MSLPCHTIKVAARLTGLSTHVIRIWEKRYGAVVPNRSGSRRRLFSEADLSRLVLLRRATEMGHSIGNIARLPEEELRQLLKIGERTGSEGTMPGAKLRPEGGEEESLGPIMTAIRAMDSRAMEEQLTRASLTLGNQGLLQQVVAPLAQRLGEAWEKGELTAAHEHFATAVLRDFLAQARHQYAHSDGAPGLVVATPAGQLHELGAIMVAAAASNLGWKVLYLGPSLPAAEIAGAAAQNRARAVALSIVYPSDDVGLAAELIQLRKLLPTEIKILAGGRAAGSYATALRKIGALTITDLPQLFETLGQLRLLAH